MSPGWITELTPLSFLERSAEVFSDKPAIIYGDRTLNYREFAAEVTRYARALLASGIEPDDRVAVLCPNIPEMLIAHFAVPLAGAVLVAVNTRLSAEEIRYILDHSGAKLLVVDAEFLPGLASVLPELKTVREVVVVTDPAAPAAADAGQRDAGRGDSGQGVTGPAVASYPDLLARGSDEPLPWTVDDERAMISINYTSGTTGRPKGVMYTHRGAYLNALGEVIHSRFAPDSRYLWTLPMFHCNGWCTPWAVTGVGGTHVCLRAVRADVIWNLFDEQGITHLDGSPTVLVTIANAPQAHQLDREIVMTVAGAPPSPTIIARIGELGGRIVHVYGLTESYGPYSVNETQASWADLDAHEQAQRRARQGVAMIQADPVRVVDEYLDDVPRDGATMGEIVLRGNNVMKGYYLDDEATDRAFRGGWFHSGDLGVQHPDGYIQLRDRQKDIIISGGENISTVEVEQAIDSHPGVLEVAVIGVPDEKWGERPKAFVVRKPGAPDVTAEEIISHVQSQIARFKSPKSVEFVDALPKTATGKVRKVEFREKEWAGHAGRIQG